MLLIFKGPSCRTCPFFSLEDRPMSYYKNKVCGLSKGYDAVTGLSFDIIPDEDKIPTECPFSKYPNTLEIECRMDK